MYLNSDTVKSHRLVRGRFNRGFEIMWRLDRLTRSPFDLVSVSLPLFEAHQVKLVGVSQHIDTSTANGRLSLNLLVSFVEFEREAIGDHREPPSP